MPIRFKCAACNKTLTALTLYLEKIGMTPAAYHQLEVQANRPWVVDGEGRIVIPRHQLESALVQAAYTAPAGSKIPVDQLRSLVQVSDFRTEKTKRDRLFERFVMPKDGKGNPLSNQRRFTSHEVIEDFEATGTIDFDAAEVKQKTLLDLLRYCGKYVGVGASRKMGYGRFEVVN